MRHNLTITSIVTCAGLCMTAAAQDSTSTGASGDALSPWSSETQCAQYVVDLSPIATSKGNIFGVAPLVKSSKLGTTNDQGVVFFNNLTSSSSISPVHLINVDPTGAEYDFWDAPGFGINPQANILSKVALAPQGNVNQFAVGISEFGFGLSEFSFDGLIGAVVQYEPGNANRLYVDRRMIAVDSTSATSGDTATIGFGTVDANGNFYYRSDAGSADNPVSGIAGIPSLFGNNIYRTRFFDRNCETINHISNGPTLDATDVLVDDFTTPDGENDNWNPPSNIPQSIAMGNGIAATTNFMSQYAYGPAATLSTTTSHFDLSNGWLGDHRGSLSAHSKDVFNFGSDYNFAVLAKDAGDTTLVFNAFGVDTSGAVVGVKGFETPTTITDNEDMFSISYSGAYEYLQYRSQTAFQGGNGQLALGSDTEGRALMAATMHESGFPDDFTTQIVVCRYDEATGAEEWTFAAYVDQTTLGGKEICNAEGEAIGQITSLLNVTGGAPLGPGMSSPAFDSAGNVWFISSVELFNRIDTNNDGMGDTSDFDSGVIRAIYDPATFSYKLELVLELGSQIQGLNSGSTYRIDFLQTADNNSVSSGTMFSSNVSESSWNDTDISCLEPSDTRTNGGVFFGTSITYDIDGDGFFNDPTSGFFDPERPADESYNVGLYITHFDDGTPTEPCPSDCPADLDNSGTLNFGDVTAFLTLYGMGDLAADLDNSGSLNFGDVTAFLTFYGQGCP